MKIKTVGPKGKRVYNSVRAAARVLSGDGTDRPRQRISRLVKSGGGFVGKVWVQAAPE